MKNFIMAVLFLCYPNNGCEEKSILVEERACKVAPIDAKIFHAGEPIGVRIGIRCKRK